MATQTVYSDSRFANLAIWIPEMMARNRICTLLALLSLLITSGSQAAGDTEKGKLKAFTCTGCHGIPGYNNVNPIYHVPKVGGQNAEYIEAALKGYRTGERKHPTMSAQAESLSDEDIQNIAAYFASVDGK